MKGLSCILFFLGGAIVGAAIGILIAPAKGCETRDRIRVALKEKGIMLSEKELDKVVLEVANEEV